MLVLVTRAPNRRDTNASLVLRSFSRGRPDRLGRGLDDHLSVPVPGAGASILAGDGPLVPVTAEELADLSLQGSRHQQMRAEPADLKNFR